MHPPDDPPAAVVPAIDAPSSVACLRSLGRRGVPAVAVSEDPDAAAFRSRYCTEARTVPDPHEDLPGYRDALRSLAERPDVATVIPVREEDVYVLARDREAFAPHVGTPWPDLETLRLAQDRLALYERAAAAGVAVPETSLLSEAVGRDGPRVVKARYALLGEAYLEDYPPGRTRAPPGTTYLPAGSDPDAAALRAEMGHDPIVQAYLPGTDEYAFFALYDRGEPVATFQHRQRRGYDYAGGPSAYREAVDLPALDAAGRAVLDALDWHGLAMVEFLRDPDGEFALMEVNPRFWSSLPFTVQAGADLPYYYWLQALEMADVVEATYDDEAAGHLLRGEAAYLHSVLFADHDLVERPSTPAAARSVAASLVRHPRFDYLQPDDPAPFFRDLRNQLGALAPTGD